MSACEGSRELVAELKPSRGSVPPGLRGVYVKNGPAPFGSSPRPTRHPYDEDGLLQSYTFDGGDRVLYRRKYAVQPEARRAANRALFTGAFGSPGALPFPFVRDTGNTSVHPISRGRVLVGSDGGRPRILDARTLDPVQVIDDIPSMIAHVRDLGGKTLVGRVVYDDPLLRGCTVRFDSLNSQLLIEKIATVRVPRFFFVHDFVCCEGGDEIVFFESPAEIDRSRISSGGIAGSVRSSPGRTLRAHVVLPNSHIFEADTGIEGFCFHHVHARKQANTIVVTSIVYPSFFTVPDPRKPGRLVEFEIDLVARTCSVRSGKYSPEVPWVEFPSSVVMSPETQRPVFYALDMSSEARSIVRVCERDGRVSSRHVSREGTVLGEPCVASSPYVLSTRYCLETGETSLVVLVQDGCELKLACEIPAPPGAPMGLHGCFVRE